MGKSKAYEELLRQVNATGTYKLDGYSTDILDNISDDERAEVEHLIWNIFFDKNDIDIAVLFPKLKLYDGIQALKNTVDKLSIPSSASMLLSFLIYDSTKEITYLNKMERNVIDSKYDYSYISMLIYVSPCEEVYQTLVRMYKNCSDRVACGSIVNGILYNKGFIKDMNCIEDVSNMKELRKTFKNATAEQKDELLKKLDDGEFDYYRKL